MKLLLITRGSYSDYCVETILKEPDNKPDINLIELYQQAILRKIRFNDNQMDEIAKYLGIPTSDKYSMRTEVGYDRYAQAMTATGYTNKSESDFLIDILKEFSYEEPDYTEFNTDDA